MNTNRSTQPRAALLVACSAALLALAGCEDKTEIRTYTTPKETPGVVNSAPAQSAASTGEEPIHWSLPEGWTQEPGDDIRFATLTDARSDPPLTITVTKLPARAGDLLANVNRWRGQLGLAPIDEAQMVQDVHPLEGVPLAAVLVDLVAPEAGGGEPARMLAAVYETPVWTWFLKCTAPSSQLAARQDEVLAIYRSVHLDSAGGHGVSTAPTTSLPPAGLPETDTPIGAAPTGAPVILSAPTDQPLVYTVPEGWREDPNPRPARLGTLLIGDDAVLAEMAITRFPGDVGGELANVNRWRGQLGLPTITSLAEQGGADVTINGLPGRVYRIAGPGEGEMQTGILVAFVERDGHIWFFKTVGPIDVLDAHRAKFDAFLSSIQFQGG